MISSVRMGQLWGGCAQVICKDYATLYKGLEHPQILVPMGVGMRVSWNQYPQMLRDDCTSSCRIPMAVFTALKKIIP